MYQVYYFDIQDSFGNVNVLKLRGPLLPDDNARRNQMVRFRNRINQVSLSEVVRESYGWERVRNIGPIGPQAFNQIGVSLCYTTPSGNSEKMFVPAPNLPNIDFIIGDLVDLTDNPIANFVSRIESEAEDLTTGEAITFQYAVLIGTGE